MGWEDNKKSVHFMNWETIHANGEGKLGIRSRRQRNWKSLSKRDRRHGEGRQVIDATYGKQNRGWRPNKVGTW